MASEHKRLPHLLVTKPPASEPYTAHGSRGGDKPTLPKRSRAQHGKRLRAEYEKAWEDARALAGPTGATVRIALEFSGARGFELPLDSLENAPARIQLLAVRQENETVRATVAVPEAAREHFLKRIDAFLTKDTKSGAPQNQPLIASIERIAPASLDSRWTDTVPPPSDLDATTRWEVWILTDGVLPSVVLAHFREAAARAKLAVSSTHQEFVDRLVVLVRATTAQLVASREVMSLVAEVRIAKESAEFFTRMARSEQDEWVEDLVARTSTAPPNSPVVCLLDTGVNRAHPLLAPSLAETDMHAWRKGWGTHDDHSHGHGTSMAGVALLGDLTEVLASREPVPLTHRLESSKMLSSTESNPPELYGAIMRGCVALPEIEAPSRKRVFCTSITATDGRDRGEPSSWSAEVDRLCVGLDDESGGRLVVLSAGNAPWPSLPSDYPDANLTDPIHDPGQAWNALTIGGFTEKVHITEEDLVGWKPLAPAGDLCPTTTTSRSWDRSWPLKPDLVMEGGNLAVDPSGQLGDPDSLRVLTTHHKPHERLVDVFNDTSASSALASRMAAELWAQYPLLRPETVRALLVHSASWTAAMLRRVPGTKRVDVETRLRVFGHGAPRLDRALWSARDALTLVIEQDLQPFEDGGSKEMHVHSLPWPVSELEALGETPVTLRVTLSYFIEPNPARRGWTSRHRYASHGLRFEMQTPVESLKQFRARVNAQADDGDKGDGDAKHWELGPLRSRGSIHADRWHGKAVDLAARKHLAVFPVIGWWRERSKHPHANQRVRYALLVSIDTPGSETDLHTPVAALAGVQALRTEVSVEVG